MERSNWLIFSAIVLVLAGIMRILDAIWAFRYNGPVVDNLHDAIFGHSLTTYGWIWLLVGIVLIASGFLFASSMTLGAQVGRWIGIVAAGIAAITAVSWLAHYPVLVAHLGLSVLVIYGLAVHFDKGRQRGESGQTILDDVRWQRVHALPSSESIRLPQRGGRSEWTSAAARNPHWCDSGGARRGN